METSKIAKALIDNCEYDEPTARVHAHSKGYCVYCGADLLDSMISYWAMQIEHLLPKCDYQEFKEREENLVTGCTPCNQMKYNFDPLLPGEEPEQMLTERKDDLIQRVRDYLKDRIKSHNESYKAVKAIIRK